MTAASYTTAYRLTLAHEGGFVCHPRDPGGATNKGVTQASYDAYRVSEGKPKRSVEFIEAREVASFYMSQHWLPISGDRLPAGLDYAVYDFGVNSGVVRAVKALQQFVGVGVDGHAGFKTLAAVRIAAARNEELLINQYCELRQRFVERIDTFDEFGKGWTRRINEVKVNAVKLARADTEFVMPSAVAGKAYLRAA